MFPTIPTTAGSTLLSTTTSTASTTHTFPNLTTLAPAAGDLIIAICVAYEGDTVPQFSSWGASLTEILDDSLNGTGNGAIGVAYKVASGSESGTFTVTSANSWKSVNFLMRIPAGTWDSGTAPAVQAATRAAGAAANPASFDPAGWGAEDTLWIAVGGHTETTTTGSPPTLDTAPTNFSGALIVARAADAVGDITAAVAFRQENASAQDVATWTTSNASRGNGVATVIAVRPKPPVLRTITDTGLGTFSDTLAISKTKGISIVDWGLSSVVYGSEVSKSAPDWWYPLGKTGDRASGDSGNLQSIGLEKNLIAYGSDLSLRRTSLVDTNRSGYSAAYSVGRTYLPAVMQTAIAKANSWTIEFWFWPWRLNSAGYYYYIVGNGEYNGGIYTGWYLAKGGASQGRLMLMLGNSGSVTAYTVDTDLCYTTKNPRLITVTWDTTQFEIFVDGVSKGTFSGAWAESAGQQYTIYQHEQGTISPSAMTDAFIIQHFQQYKRVLGSTEILAHYDDRKKVISELDGTYVPAQNNGLTNRAVYFTAGDNPGSVNQNSYLDGFIDNSVSSNILGQLDSLAGDANYSTAPTEAVDIDYNDTTSAWTAVPNSLEVVFTLTSLAATVVLVNKWASNLGWKLQVSTAGDLQFISDTTTQTLATGLVVGPRYHVVVIARNTGSNVIRAYVNNVEQTEVAHTIPTTTTQYIQTGTTGYRLGRVGFESQVELTATDVGRMYNSAFLSGFDSLTFQKTTGNIYSRTPSDTGLSFSESLRVFKNKHVLADTGLSGVDALVSNRSRKLTDTGLGAFSDSLVFTKSKGRSITDTGLTSSDSLVRTLIGSRRLYDAGLNYSGRSVGTSQARTFAADYTKADVNGTELTVVALARPGDYGASPINSITYVGKGQANWYNKYSLYASYSRNTHFLAGGEDVQANSVDTLGKVSFFAGVKRGLGTGKLELWVDGSLVATADSNNTLTASTGGDSYYVADAYGDYSWCSVFWSAVWSVALTQSELDQLRAGVDPRTIQSGSLVGYWQHMGGRPTDEDLSGNGATLTPGVPWDGSDPSSDSFMLESLLRKRPVNLTDTGLTQTDSIKRYRASLLTDTGLGTFGDTLDAQKFGATSYNRTATDTGLTQTDSLVPTRAFFKAATDTGLTNSDTLVSLRKRVFADTGLTHSDTLAGRISHSLSDTGLGAINDSLLDLRSRFLTDTGIGQTDSITPTRRFGKTATDTGLTNSDTLAIGRSRSCLDTGLTQSDSLVPTRRFGKGITDTGLTVSDTLVDLRGRALTDTGLTSSDTLVKTVWLKKSATDTGLTQTDVLAERIQHSMTDTGITPNDSLLKGLSYARAVSDTGLTNTDSIYQSAIKFRSASDTGLTNSDTLRAFKSLSYLSDTGLTSGDSLAITKSVNKTATDTGLTNTDTLLSLRRRSLTDTGLTNTDSLVRNAAFFRVASDTGLSQTDVLSERIAHALSDTGLTQTDSLVRYLAAARTSSDTGLTSTDTLVSLRSHGMLDTGITSGDFVSIMLRRMRTALDTGLTNTDSLSKQVSLIKTLTDTGLTNTDSLVKNVSLGKTLSDTVLGQSDSLVIGKAIGKALSDTGIAFTESMLMRSMRPLSDTGLTQTDVLAERISHNLADTGITPSDSLVRFLSANRSLSDSVLTVTDVIRAGPGRAKTDTGLTQSDTLARSYISRSISDQGLTQTDTLVSRRSRFATDTVITPSDSLVAVRRLGKALTDAGVTQTDTLVSLRSRLLSDTALTNTDSVVRTVVDVRALTDTGITQTDAVLSRRARVAVDTGLTNSDTLVRFVQNVRSLSDTGLSQTDVLAEQISHSMTDAGLTQSDSLVRLLRASRAVSDPGVSVSDSISQAAIKLRSASDSGLTSSSDSLLVRLWRARVASDTALANTDSILRVAQAFRVLSDTGMAVSDSIAVTAGTAITDTGIAQSDTLVASRRLGKVLSDTGLTNTDTLVSSRVRVKIDTGLTNTDSLARTMSWSRALSDNGLNSITSVLVTTRLRPIADTGLTQTDSVRPTAWVKALVDTGLSQTDVLAERIQHSLADTGITQTDTLARKSLLKVLSDTGLSSGDAIVKKVFWSRPLTDTGLTMSDSIATTSGTSIADTGLTQTDALVLRVARIKTDTGLTVSDLLTPTGTRSPNDTGLTFNESLAARRSFFRAMSDTVIGHTDDLSKRVAHPLSDTGLTNSDSLRSGRVRVNSDIGLTSSDSLLRAARFQRVLSDTGLSLSDSVATSKDTDVGDTGLTQSDTLKPLIFRYLIDLGLLQSDSLVKQAAADVQLSDVGLSVSDVLEERKEAVRILNDYGITFTVGVVKQKVANRVNTDTGINAFYDFVGVSAQTQAVPRYGFINFQNPGIL